MQKIKFLFTIEKLGRFNFLEQYYSIKLQIRVMYNKTFITILTFILTTIISEAQFNPIWQASAYIEAQSVIVVNNNQKTTGVYSFPVTFGSIYLSPKLVLAIPQLRIVSGSTIEFKIDHSSLTSTSVTLNLNIADPTTSIWFMANRYLVISSSLHSKEFQIYYSGDVTGSNINATPNGLYRSDSLPLALLSSSSVSNSPTCLVFLAGVKASSSDHYQFNLTCTAQSSSSAQVIATVYPNTKVEKYSYYAFVWDPAYLALQYFYYVDFAITTTYYNVQKSFINLLYGYLQKGYEGGISSFSTTSNQQLNISLSSLKIQTTLSSVYDAIPQFQVRFRNCPASYAPMYNQLDGLCYAVCPQYTYSVPSAFLCKACPSNCITCFNSTICTVCTTGMMIINNLCVCSNYTYEFGGVCYGCHYSCLTCTATGQYYNCLTCDPAANREQNAVLGFNNICKCKSGYEQIYQRVCSEICGDRVARNAACDDGNTVSGDGCSSSCSIQQYFTCTMDSTNFSSCYFVGNITLQLYKIYKLDYENTVKIYLKVTPWISAMTALANSNALTSNLSSETNQLSYSSDHDMLVYTVTYKEDIKDQYISVYLKSFSPGIFSKMLSANCTFQLKSDNGLDLHLFSQTQYKVAESFHYICKVFGFLIFGSSFLYIFGRLKWVGNLLFFSLQFQYVSMIIIPSFTPMLSGLSQIKSVMGFNQIFPRQTFDLPSKASMYVLKFSKPYDYNINIMLSLQIFALIMYLVYYITYRRNQLVCKKYGGDPQKSYRSLRHGKILHFFDWEFFMFWTFFNMTEQIIGMILYQEEPTSWFVPIMFFNAVCIFLAVFPLFFRRKLVKSYSQLLYYEGRGRQESIVSFCLYVLMYLMLTLAILIDIIIFYFIFLIPILMIIYLFCRKPFQSRWIRAAYFINCLCILIGLVYDKLTIAFEQQVYYLPFGNIIIILLDWIFNLVIWGREAYVLCKYGGEKDLNQLLISNTKSSSARGDDDAGYFKDMNPISTNNPSFLRPLMKKQSTEANNKIKFNRNKKFQQDLPQGLRQEYQAKIDEQEYAEREDLKKKRQEWAKQIKQMKEIKTLRERTKHQIQNNSKTLKRNNIRRTGQKGIDQSIFSQIQQTSFSQRMY